MPSPSMRTDVCGVSSLAYVTGRLSVTEDSSDIYRPSWKANTFNIPDNNNITCDKQLVVYVCDCSFNL